MMTTLPKIENTPAAPGAVVEEGMKPAQHFFHVLGADIIIDSNGKPLLLELNDRPSLAVTVPFESELKTNMLHEVFYHVTADGSTLGENENSGWQQILPVPELSPLKGPIQRVMSVRSELKYLGRAASESPGTTRMIEQGIQLDRHEECRKRANLLMEVSKGPRFQHYLRTGPL
jgi:hypothetical protein